MRKKQKQDRDQENKIEAKTIGAEQSQTEEGRNAMRARRAQWLLLIFPILLLGAAVSLFLPIHGEEKIYDTVVRLHVLANSDSEEDQALKLEVRDRILEVSAPLLLSCKTQAEAENVLREQMPVLQQEAEEVILAAGYAYPVQVLLDWETYPRRVYENCAFPAGRYLSLRICIGEAEGHNWWCVLFPPLCLSAATAQSKEEKEDRFVEVGLTPDQYKVITESETDTRYRVRFRFLELLQSVFH